MNSTQVANYRVFCICRLVRKPSPQALVPRCALMTASAWNGNVDLTQIDAMLGIAVFNEDQALFDDLQI